MRIFHCDHCDNLVFFENTHCVQCGHLLAFLPDLMEIGSLDPDGEQTWRSPHPAAERRTYRLCANYSGAQVCNWAVDARHGEALCEACRLTTTIPDLAVEGNQAAWYKLEVAKRRLLYTLLSLRLPIVPRSHDPRGLAFEFLADAADGPPTVLTGHTGGVITISLAEADDAERERRRHALGEPYRTLARPRASRVGSLLLGSAHRRHRIGTTRSAPCSATSATTTRRRCSATTPAARRPTGRRGSSPPTPACIRGRTGPKPGPITCTSPTRSRRRRPAACRSARGGVTSRRSPSSVERGDAGQPVRSPDHELVSGDLSAQQPQSRPGHHRRLSVRPVAAGGRETPLRARHDRARFVRPADGRWHAVAAQRRPRATLSRNR